MQTRQPVRVTGTSNRNIPKPVRTSSPKRSGRTTGDDPVLPWTGGPAGNAVLTAWTGLVVLGLSLAELVTLLSVHRLIGWHVVIGTLFVPPATLKTASVGWRIIRYYGRDANYRQAGPPRCCCGFWGPASFWPPLACSRPAWSWSRSDRRRAGRS
jgi:hypothetical protein